MIRRRVHPHPPPHSPVPTSTVIMVEGPSALLVRSPFLCQPTRRATPSSSTSWKQLPHTCHHEHVDNTRMSCDNRHTGHVHVMCDSDLNTPTVVFLSMQITTPQRWPHPRGISARAFSTALDTNAEQLAGKLFSPAFFANLARMQLAATQPSWLCELSKNKACCAGRSTP